MLIGAVGAYGRHAYAACSSVGSSTYECSGTNSSTQTINAANANVRTLSGFSVTTSSGNGITVTGDGTLSFTDLNYSTIKAASTGLYIKTNVVASGNIVINTNGTITGNSFGISARNRGGGALTITANGDVTGTTSRGIFALNSGTDLIVTTGAGGSVTGATYGIFGRNYGTGVTTVTANGDVTGTATNSSGIFLRNSSAGTDLNVTTGAGSSVSAGRYGIFARNDGSGALNITLNGDVTGGADDGVYARNAGGGSVFITVGSASHVTSNGSGSEDFGIDTRGGPASVTVAGTVNGGVGGAIRFDQSTATADRLELQPGATINGLVLAGPGTDSLVFGGAGDGTFDISSVGSSQQYRDFEIFIKEDQSDWTFTGTNLTIPDFTVNGGQLTVAGDMTNTAFTINGGVLDAAGTLGAVTIASGGWLQGLGTVGALDVGAGGTVAPGEPSGILTASGNVSFASGSTLQVVPGPSGTMSELYTPATATIAGGNVQVVTQGADPFVIGHRYTILTADGGRIGVFDSLIQTFPLLDMSLAYDANNVYLDVARNSTTLCSLNVTWNQCAASTADVDLGASNAVVNAVRSLPDLPSIEHALDLLSGEAYASVRSVLLQGGRFMKEMVMDRLRQEPEAPGPAGAQIASAADFAVAEPPAAEHAVWARAMGTFGHVDGDGNTAKTRTSTGGISIGADTQVTDELRLGTAVGYSRSTFDVNERNSSATSNDYHVALYGAASFGALGLRFGTAYTWHDIRMTRDVAFMGFAENEEADYSAHTTQLFGEAGYTLQLAHMALEPFAQVAYVNLVTDGFTENGGSAALSLAESRDDVTYTTLGLHAASNLTLSDGRSAALHATLGWRHAFGDVSPFSATSIDGSSTFDIYGVRVARDTLVVDGGFDVALANSTFLGLFYSGQLSNGGIDNGGGINFTYRF